MPNVHALFGHMLPGNATLTASLSPVDSREYENQPNALFGSLTFSLNFGMFFGTPIKNDPRILPTVEGLRHIAIFYGRNISEADQSFRQMLYLTSLLAAYDLFV